MKALENDAFGKLEAEYELAGPDRTVTLPKRRERWKGQLARSSEGKPNILLIGQSLNTGWVPWISDGLAL
jgi:hypothetical protein